MPALAAALDYPQAVRGSVTDDYFGTRVADPYRWLEDIDSPQTQEWEAAENRLTLPFLAALPERPVIHAQLTRLWNYQRYDLPQKVAGKYFYARNDGLQNQSVLYVQASLDRPARVLLDPNTLSADGTVALAQWQVSPDGRWLAYATATAGSDWNTFRVRDVASGKDTHDLLTHIKFSGIAWTHDNAGFFYSRYPGTAPHAGVFEKLENQRLYYHRLGTPQFQDQLIYDQPAHPRRIFNATVTDDGRYALVSVARGASNNTALYYKDLGDPSHPRVDAPVQRLVGDFENVYNVIGNRRHVLYVFTDRDAPRGRMIAIDLHEPRPGHWRTVVPQQRDVINAAVLADGQLVVSFMHDASARLRRYTLAGKFLGEIGLPGPGALDAVEGQPQISGRAGDPEMFYAYTSFNRPPTNYYFNVRSSKGGVFQAPELNFNPDDYVTEEVFCTSKDGTRIPLFISYRKGLKKSANTPAYLYGYGGFDISLTPSFSVPNLVWMARGGIYVQAILRGGGEYGSTWHDAGAKSHKQNVLDDFTAAAGYLIDRGWTSSAHLAIGGRSNGGLLIGAVLNQHPHLFAAALAGVGVMDMLRFQKFTIGQAWETDYGSSDDAAGFRWLYAYSPYHNIRPGTQYPAVLVTTADHDDRVYPAHSFKYAAALQYAQAGDKPVLIRIESRAGHGCYGCGEPVGKLIELWADQLAFIAHYTQK
ncbi:MAG: prolyl oligopeptidase family serine peptidase [Stenotrophobium sp.]